MGKAKKLDEYLNIKSEIIKPALQQLRLELLQMGYSVELVEGGIERDLLLNEKGELEKIHSKRTHLLGQISLKIKNDLNHVQVVVIGYVGGNVEIVNPQSEEVSLTDLNDIDTFLIKRQVREKLNISKRE